MENVILQPIEVGGQTFKNRIMFPPLTTGYEKNGMISEQDMGFYTRLAKGGVGYIVLGDVAPINSFSPTPKLFDDSQIPAFKALADSVHAYGTKLGVQLFHPEYDVDAINSLFMQKKFDEMRQRLHHDMMFFTDEVSEEMLMSIIDKMCACAVRAQKAGVDVIQIHGDRLNGCLCSTRMNHRTDKFGGSLENRVRFARMLTRAIRKAVPDMVIDYKLSIVTPQRGKGGIDEADAVQFAQWLVEDGVDMFHVAQANHTGNMADTIPPMGVQPYGFFVKIAGDIKKAVNVPVSAVGRIVDADMAARVIESGMADIVAMGRPLLADPDWGTKIAAGKACDIRRCISCNKGCTDAIQNRQFLSCVLNAENGYENTRSIQPAAQKKKIAVLGGGPAGLEAARVAALRGHDVTLFEKTTSLGGQLNIACVPPRKEEMRRATQDLIHAVCNAGVHLCMGQTRTAEQLKDAGFEAVINAVGAHSAAPRIPGIDSVNVADAWKVLAGEQQVYGTVAVIGGGMVGCETAEYLAARGCKVSVIEMMDKIAAGESTTILPTLLENYKTYGVEQYPSHKVKEFRMDAVVCENKDGAEVTIPCDYIVLAMGARSNEFDAAALEAASIPVYSIGDAAGKVDVVVLEHDGRRQVVTVVAAAANADSVLFKNAVVGAGLTGVQQGDAGAFQQGRHLMGIGGNAAHSLQVVQRNALTGKQGAYIARNNGQLLAGLYGIAVPAEEFHLGAGVQQRKDAGIDRQTGNNAVLLGNQIHGAGAGVGHDGVCGNVLLRNILPQRLQQQRVYMQQLGDLIHGFYSSQ